MGLDSIIVRQITSVTKNSGKLDATVDKIKSKVLDQGLGLLQETGIDPTLIPVHIHIVGVPCRSASKSPRAC